MDAQDNHIHIWHGVTADGRPAVCLRIPPACRIEVEGAREELGVAMPSAQAREIAYALLLHVAQLDSGSVELPKAAVAMSRLPS